MSKYEAAIKLSDDKFQELTGIKRTTFNKIVNILRKYEVRRGNKNKLSLEDRLMMLLEYFRNYKSLFSVGYEYGIHKTNANHNIKKIIKLLQNDEEFKNLLKQELIIEENSVNILEEIFLKKNRGTFNKETGI